MSVIGVSISFDEQVSFAAGWAGEMARKGVGFLDSFFRIKLPGIDARAGRTLQAQEECRYYHRYRSLCM